MHNVFRLPGSSTEMRLSIRSHWTQLQIEEYRAFLQLSESQERPNESFQSRSMLTSSQYHVTTASACMGMSKNKAKGRGNRNCKGNGRGQGKGQGSGNGSGKYQGKGKEKTVDDSTDDESVEEDSSNPRPRLSRKRKQGKARTEAKPLKALAKALRQQAVLDRQTSHRRTIRIKQLVQGLAQGLGFLTIFWIWVVYSLFLICATAMLRHLHGGPLDSAWRVEFLTFYMGISLIILFFASSYACMWLDGTLKRDEERFEAQEDTSEEDSD